MSIPIGRMLTIGLLPSPLKVLYYRLKGARIGKRVRIGFFSTLEARQIVIGDDARIGPLCFLKLRDKLALGNRVRINAMVAVDTGSMSVGDDTTIMEQVIIGGMLSPRSILTVGKRVKIFPHAFLNPTKEITIEDDVGVGGGSYIFTHGTWQNVLDGYSASFGPVHIKRNAWLPWRVFVTAGVTIGQDAIIAPHAVVNQSVPDGGIANGVPAKPIDMQYRHVRKLTPAHRFKLMTNILTEFAEHETWLGNPTSVAVGEPGRFQVRHPSGDVLLTLDSADASGSHRLLLSLDTISADVRKELSQAGRDWLDLGAKEAPAHGSKIAESVRTYLSRYGIRFNLQ